MSEDLPFRIEAVDVDVVLPLRRALLWPDQPEASVRYRSDDDPSARHFAARDGSGLVIGVGSVYFEDRHAGLEPFGTPGMRIRGMAVEGDWQGKGVGGGLLEAMLRVAGATGINEAWANVRAPSRGFYERRGFRGMSSEFELPALGPHVVMARSLDPARGLRGRRRRRASRAQGGGLAAGPSTD